MLPPIVALLGLGGVLAYFPAIDSATEAYDLALTDAGIALGERIRREGTRYTVDLPRAAEQVLRTDRYDTIYYRVLAPDDSALAGDPDLPAPPRGTASRDGVTAYDTHFHGRQVRAVLLRVPCGGATCTVQVAETTNKRQRLIRNILLSSLLPEALIALALLVIVWFGVTRGLAPLGRLSDEIRARTPKDLAPIESAQAPAEARALVDALNQLLERVAAANRNQQRFLENAAHQLRTPLAGLQAHTELALRQEDPQARRAALGQVQRATVRTARIANQLLALARAEPGGLTLSAGATVDLRPMVESVADEWVHRALARSIDLGFELADCRVHGHAMLLREAFVNILHNALEYAPQGGTVTARTGVRGAEAVLEVEDDGPGIAEAERERVLERFYRVEGSRGEGSGLGLAIVQEIAAAHGARLRIGAGAGGRGTIVTLAFAQA